MLHRRRFLALGLAGGTLGKFTMSSTAVGAAMPVAVAVPGEGVFDYIQRVHGKWDAALYKQLLGAANEFKEGDAIIGVAAVDDDARRQARGLLASTRVSEIDLHPPFRDELFQLITSALNHEIQQQMGDLTLGSLKTFLLERSESEIHAIRDGLSSDVIACVVRLMSNAELIQVGAKVFNPLPESNIGARGYMGARVQPYGEQHRMDARSMELAEPFPDGHLTLTATLNTAMELHFFDPNTTAAILYRKLPHWSQAGVVCFITFRLHDSMPREVIDGWHQERGLWLRQNGINPNKPTWRDDLQALDHQHQLEFYSTFSTRWHDELDSCHGSCVLRNPENSKIVADSLLKFDGDRYWLTDFVVMPNHAHLLVVFPDDDSMLLQCEAWKRFTGRKINQRMAESGRFWQQDGFDHLVRSETQFEHFRRYISDNPRKARLKPGEYVMYSDGTGTR